MNIAERVEQYEKCGFARETAAVNVLLEETLQIIVVQFSGHVHLFWRRQPRPFLR
jgi:hypothetical protein